MDDGGSFPLDVCEDMKMEMFFHFRGHPRVTAEEDRAKIFCGKEVAATVALPFMLANASQCSLTSFGFSGYSELITGKTLFPFLSPSLPLSSVPHRDEPLYLTISFVFQETDPI